MSCNVGEVTEMFSEHLRSFQILKRESEREWMRKVTGSYCTYSIPDKTAALVNEFAVEDLPSAELQPRFLSLHYMTCPWVEHSDDDDDDDYTWLLEDVNDCLVENKCNSDFVIQFFCLNYKHKC